MRYRGSRFYVPPNGGFIMKKQENKIYTQEHYQEMYNLSITDPNKFWGEAGKRLSWIKPYTKVKDTSFDLEDLHIKWFEDGTLNACYNAVDRHIEDGHGDNIAIIWESNFVNEENDESYKITYNELKKNVCRFANTLKDLGVRRGDIVTIYMPMVPETVYAMLACARIGAIHSVVFSGFSAESLSKRIVDTNSKIIITTDGSYRGDKVIDLKSIVDKALEMTPVTNKVLVCGRTNKPMSWNGERDIWYNSIAKYMSDECEIEEMHAEDPLFILYTSGSTGTPKGIMHTTGGYLVYASMTHEYAFDYKEGDIFWCTADIGWITGHSYLVYGPLTNGATTLIFEGVPNYPCCSRVWNICDKYGVNILYTAPTLLRILKKEGDFFVTNTSRSSLRVLGSVGEPMQADLWQWYNDVVGNNRCDIIDTWWQTEGGGIMISPLAGFKQSKAGSVSFPFFGINPYIVDNDGKPAPNGTEGNLVIKDSWPGQARTVYKNLERFKNGYFSTFKNFFFSGDGAYTDQDGYIHITGRVDDIINVSGHRVSTAGVEFALNSNPNVAESAVVGFPHEIKGTGLGAFVVMKSIDSITDFKATKNELKSWVRKKNGPTEVPDVIYIVEDLPKTRSGKIIRRILRKLAEDPKSELGDLSTLSNQDSIHKIIDILAQ